MRALLTCPTIFLRGHGPTTFRVAIHEQTTRSSWNNNIYTMPGGGVAPNHNHISSPARLVVSLTPAFVIRTNHLQSPKHRVYLIYEGCQPWAEKGPREGVLPSFRRDLTVKWTSSTIKVTEAGTLDSVTVPGIFVNPTITVLYQCDSLMGRSSTKFSQRVAHLD